MAQIIKHRRGSITQLKDVTARIGELVVATGSISDLNGPIVFIGETDGVAGAYRPISKIYQGSSAPTISVGSHGSVIDGTPFYATGNKTLYILSKDGNSDIDLTGNIEGNTISGVTIQNLNSGVNINGSIHMVGDHYITGNTIQTGSIDLTGNVTLGGNITIGNQTTDLVVFQGEVSSSILPEVNNAFDLGAGGQAWRNLYVSGTANVGVLNAETISLSGITVFEDLIVNGNTYLGNSGSDNVFISGSTYVGTLTNNRVTIAGVNGILEDDANFTFDGTTLKVGNGDFEVDVADGNIRTSGSLNVHNVLEAHSTTELKGAVGMNSTLDVTGSATFKSTIDVVGTASMGHAVVDDLVQDGIVTAGNLGELQNSSGFTFNGSVFKVGAGNFEVDVDGDIRTTGSLTIGNDLSVVDALNVGGVLTVTGQTLLQSDLFVSGNLQVLGSATNVTIQSTTVELDDNIIRLNAYSPFERYAGFEVIDSGSSGVSASLVWDGLNDYWMFVSSSGQSSKLIGTTAGTYGSEVSLTADTFPIATGLNTIGDSLLTMIASGTTLAFNTNKFTVASSDGATLIAGNVTLTAGGGADATGKTSAIVFKNSSNVLGYVSTTETTDVLDGVLGYKNSNGALVFSTVIDGGTY
jgi:hypothetical protein